MTKGCYNQFIVFRRSLIRRNAATLQTVKNYLLLCGLCGAWSIIYLGDISNCKWTMSHWLVCCKINQISWYNGGMIFWQLIVSHQFTYRAKRMCWLMR